MATRPNIETIGDDANTQKAVQSKLAEKGFSADPTPARGRPPLGTEPKTDRLVIRTEAWRVAGARLAAKRSGTTFAHFVEAAIDTAARAQGVLMPPKAKPQDHS